MEAIKLVNVAYENIAETGIFCIKNKIASGAKAKMEWFKKKCNEGLQIIIAIDNNGKQLGFIEYTSSESAWRPIAADNYFFIQCIMVYPNSVRNKKAGSLLLQACETDAKQQNKSGVCVMTSKGAWMADKTLFEKNGYVQADQLDRFELMVKKFSHKSPMPKLINWKKNQAKYKGWNLIYADQCPWHEKSANAIKEAAAEHGINLKITKLQNPTDARKAPSGFGVFSLIKDGKLLEDHYLSKTRFENILKEQLKTNY